MSSSHLISVSVLVPIKNEENYIENCLRQIFKQTYPQDKLEILIIDGMSTDSTRQIISEIKNQFTHANINILDDTKNQRASAMNIGIQHATGEVILRIDARSIIPPDYIEKCVQTLLSTGADNVGGVQKASATSWATQQAIGYAMSHRFGVGNAQFRLGTQSGYVSSVYLGCFRREVFNNVGLFDEESAVISEDSDINYRIRKSGGKVYLNKEIEIIYLPRDKIRDLAKLYFRYGGARAGFLLKWKEFTAWRQIIPPLFLSALLLLPLLSFFTNLFWYLWLLLCVLYMIADVWASADVCIRQKNWRIFLKNLAIFPTMHFSWAFGFWRRLLQKPKANQYWGF